jgi:two-component system, LuxR family, sensor kinase FixL
MRSNSSSNSGQLPPQQLLQLIVAGAPTPTLVTDPDQRITLINGSAQTLFGYLGRDLIGESVDLLLDATFRDRLCALAEQAGTGTETSAVCSGIELCGRRSDGSDVSLEASLNSVALPGGVYTLTTMVDVSGRKRAAEAKQHLESLVEFADDAIISKTLDGVVKSWNPAAERLLGYRADEIIGKSVTLLIPGDRVAEEDAILEQLRNGRRVMHFETVRRRRDGSLVDVSLTISPIRDHSGTIVGASKIMRDITESRRAEENIRRSNAELVQINGELDEFVHTASHDLRAPLLGVSRVANWILEDDQTLNAESRDRLMLILGRIGRMQRLLADVREYALAGRYNQPYGERLSATALVAEVAATLAAPPDYSVVCHPSLDALTVTKMPLQQVLHNLIDNAIKHHDRSGGVVQVTGAPAGDRIRFSVVDDGPGIAEAYHGTVFEMFRTLRPRDVVEGSGMGLALVRKIVERMGGKCGIRPTAGRGAHFWFDWPAPDAQEGS